MAGVQRFEDLIAWQKARELTAAIYAITTEGAFARDFRLKNQIRDAAVSVMSNIAEGFERGGAGEFHYFLCVAKGSCAELRSQLYTALDAKHLAPEDVDRLYAQASEVARVVGELRVAVERNRAGQ